MQDRFIFMEVARPCSDCAAQEAFWTELFDAEVLFRGRVGGDRFLRLRACGATLVFTEDPTFEAPPGPGAERHFRAHLGLRVADLDAAMAVLHARGAHFVVTPAMVADWLASRDETAEPFFLTEYIAAPLSRARIDAGEYTHQVAILQGPDNLWIELNEITEPHDTSWYRSE